MQSELHILKIELQITYTSIISQDTCSLSNSIKALQMESITVC